MRVIICIILLFVHSCANIQQTDNTERDKVLASAEINYASKNWNDRSKALLSLHGISHHKALELIEKGFFDIHSRVRIDAISVFPLNESNVHILSPLSLNDPDANVRWSALKKISDIKSKKALDVYLSALSDKDWLVRETAIKGFVSILDQQIFSDNIKTIISLLTDPQESNRIIIASALIFEDKRIYESLSKPLFTDSILYRPNYCIALLKALQYYKLDEKTRSKISSFITHPNQEIRILALQCVQLSDKRK